MKIQLTRFIMLLVTLFTGMTAARAQTVKEPNMSNPEWSQPFAPFRIAGNLYYVGTYDLACYLITTSKGNILINTGLAASAKPIRENIEALGFRYSDTKILLTNQVHFDHVGAMKTIQEETHAKIMVDEKDAGVLADGGRSDYAFGGATSSFAPLKADRLLYDGDSIKLGNMVLVILHHPGHTKGSCSFLFTVKDDQRSYRVLIANLPTIIVNGKFSEVSAYPDIASDYAYTFSAMKGLQFDIWLAAHASQFGLHAKYKPGDPYHPAAFMDQKGYDAALQDLQKAFEAK